MGSAAHHAALVACSHSRPILNIQRRRRLQQAPRRRRSLFHPFAARLLQVEALKIPPRSGRFRRATAMDRHRAASPSRWPEAQVATATVWVTSATARMASATAQHRGWATRERTGAHGRLLHGLATVAAVEAAVAQGRMAAAAVETALLACLL